MRHRITSGETAFVSIEPRLWDMRHAAKAALRDNAAKTPFVVTDEIHYYSDFVERLFLDPKECGKSAMELGQRVGRSAASAGQSTAVCIHSVGEPRNG